MKRIFYITVKFACHEMISKSLGVKVYFADPYSSWQKGGIENANGLARQYIPKSETFEHISHQQITKYSIKLNMRPRKKLKFRTPQDGYPQLLWYAQELFDNMVRQPY